MAFINSVRQHRFHAAHGLCELKTATPAREGGTLTSVNWNNNVAMRVSQASQPRCSAQPSFVPIVLGAWAPRPLPESFVLCRHLSPAVTLGFTCVRLTYPVCGSKMGPREITKPAGLALTLTPAPPPSALRGVVMSGSPSSSAVLEPG